MKKLILAFIVSIGFCNVIYSQIVISESFEGTTFPPSGWLLFNNGTGNNWIQSFSAASAGTASMRYSYHSLNPADAWAFTPAISLNAGDSVFMSFDQSVASATYPEALKITIGTAQTVIAQTTNLYVNSNLTNVTFAQRVVGFKANVSGVYYLGFNCFSAADQYNLYIDNVNIHKIVPDNIGITTILTPNSACVLSTSESISVTIKNDGINSVSNFPISYSINGGTSSVTETFVGSIAPGATANYNFSALANFSTVGMYSIKAYTNLTGDLVGSNDTAVKTIEHFAPGILTKSSTDSLIIPDNNLAGITSSMYFCGLPTTLDGTALGINYIKIDSLLHTYTKDLRIYLISPANDTLSVVYENGGTGDNIIGATFTDTASVNVSTITTGGIQPGYYYVQDPAGLMSYYNGQNPNGEWKLRVIDKTSGDVGTLYKWTLSFIIPLPNNVGVKTIASPNSDCALSSSELISITIKNDGTSSAGGFPVSYSINNGIPVTETFVGPIAPGAIMTYNFSTLANLSTVGLYTIKAYTGLIGDSIASNDTLIKIVEHFAPNVYTKSSINAPLAIPDNSPAGVNSSIYFCGLPTTLDGTSLAIDYIRIDSLLHTYTSDLRIYLISPTNDTLSVMYDNGGGGNNVIRATFIDTALTNVSTITAGGIQPGYYHVQDPAGLMSYHNGQNPNGQWKLFVFDKTTGDIGTLYKWTMSFIVPLPYNVGVKTILSPNSNCALSSSELISINIKNEGISSVSGFPVSYSINGGAAVTETFTGPIAPGAIMTYNFSALANLSTPGLYTVKAYTSLTGDPVVSNDTVTKTIEHFSTTTLVKSSTDSVKILDNNLTGVVSSMYFCGLPTTLDGTALAIDYIKIDSLLHTYTEDLRISLISPTNDTLSVLYENGGNGDNVIRATFTDTALTNVSTITAGGIQPGYYHVQDPTGLMSYHNGQNPNGQWKLFIIDNGTGDVGTLYKWTMAFIVPTAINDNKESRLGDITVSPNPTNGNINIQTKGFKGTSIMNVYNLVGEVVFTKQFNGETTQLDLTNYDKGIYFIIVENNELKYTRKVILH